VRAAVAGALFFAACAAPRQGEAPSQKAPAAGGRMPAYQGQPAQDAPHPASPSTAPAEPGAAPGAGYAPPPPPPGAPGPPADARAAGLLRAAGDLESAQRELDVAAGDCRNACRALGSMDRAAGHLCTLAATPDERQRCDAAKNKLYTARDRVRSTCGACPEGPSVERNAPVPSR
jgi:hypothetical protein